MLLRRISISKITQYYLTEYDDVELLEYVLTGANSIIFDNDKIYLNYSNKDTMQFIFDSLKRALDKSSHTTIGNKYVYEYELCKDHEEDDDIFEISTLYKTYHAKLVNVYFKSKDNLEVVFKEK